MSKIEAKNLTYSYTDNNEVYTALKSINLSIEEGEFTCLIGHSGCGKTTLLNVISGLQLPTEGELLIDGKPITGPGRDRTIVFQKYSLFAWMTARKNVLFGIKQSGRNLSKAEAEKECDYYLERVGMLEFKNKYPFQLSGGMQQRVAIARSLAMDTDILLLDEPFGAIDARRRSELQDLIIDLWSTAKKRKTVVFVTHDIDEAILLADRIVFMRPGEITKEVRIDFPRPRDKEALMASEEYAAMKSDLLSLFYLDGDYIADEDEFPL